jgi:hypothetical protein
MSRVVVLVAALLIPRPASAPFLLAQLAVNRRVR